MSTVFVSSIDAGMKRKGVTEEVEYGVVRFNMATNYFLMVRKPLLS